MTAWIDVRGEFLVPATALIVAALFSHLVTRRLLRSLFTFKHTMVRVIARIITRKRSLLEAISLGLKILVAVSVALIALAPTIVRIEKVPVRIAKEVPVELERLVRTPVVVIVDTSGSMKGEKIETAKAAVAEFVEELPEDFVVGLIAFSDTVKLAEPLTQDRARILRRVAELRPGGGTGYSAPLSLAKSWLDPYADLNVTGYIVFVTDGLPADKPIYRALLPLLKEKGIVVYSVFVGDDPAGEAETTYIAQVTGGKQYTARSVHDLPRYLKSIGREIRKTKLVEVDVEIEKEVEVREPLYEPLIPLAAAALLLLWAVNIRAYKLLF